MKRFARLLTAALAVGLLGSCRPAPGHQWHSEVFVGYFDTIITLVGYTKSDAEFDEFLRQAEAEFARLHKLYDIYSNYDGINNIKTVNDQAGIGPVRVETDLLDLVRFAKEWAVAGAHKTNIALGPVLQVWHRYRQEGLADPESAQLPPRAELEAAAKYADAAKILIDEQAKTIYLAESGMSLDLGAVAKGYATELVAQKLEQAGLISGIINAGGNVRTIGKPLDGVRDYWGVGILNPDRPLFADDRNLDVVYINDAAVVASGDYQRYYYVEDVRYHHLIDPATLLPADYYRALTVVHADSGWADLLSTELYLLPYPESRLLAESLDGVEVLWIMPDGEVRVTLGMKKLLQSFGASGQIKR